MGHAKQAKDRRGRHQPGRRGPAPERWVVVGVDGHGEPFAYPGPEDRYPGDEAPTRDEAERMAARVTGRGGRVVIRHEVWNSPAAGYRAAPGQPAG